MGVLSRPGLVEVVTSNPAPAREQSIPRQESSTAWWQQAGWGVAEQSWSSRSAAGAGWMQAGEQRQADCIGGAAAPLALPLHEWLLELDSEGFLMEYHQGLK